MLQHSLTTRYEMYTFPLSTCGILHRLAEINSYKESLKFTRKQGRLKIGTPQYLFFKMCHNSIFVKNYFFLFCSKKIKWSHLTIFRCFSEWSEIHSFFYKPMNFLAEAFANHILCLFSSTKAFMCLIGHGLIKKWVYWWLLVWIRLYCLFI